MGTNTKHLMERRTGAARERARARVEEIAAELRGRETGLRALADDALQAWGGFLEALDRLHAFPAETLSLAGELEALTSWHGLPGPDVPEIPTNVRALEGDLGVLRSSDLLRREWERRSRLDPLRLFDVPAGRLASELARVAQRRQDVQDAEAAYELAATDVKEVAPGDREREEQARSAVERAFEDRLRKRAALYTAEETAARRADAVFGADWPELLGDVRTEEAPAAPPPPERPIGDAPDGVQIHRIRDPEEHDAHLTEARKRRDLDQAAAHGIPVGPVLAGGRGTQPED